LVGSRVPLRHFEIEIRRTVFRQRLRSTPMFEPFHCECIYVEFGNDRIPRSGRIEYRARLCDVCRARGALLRADGRSLVALGSDAPRYQRTH
jgi:hypothetical protein